VTDEDVHRLALALPEAVEGSHMRHADFRVGGKIFATLPRAGLAKVKLTPEEQAMVTEAEPAIFAPVPGGWGRHGSTYVTLAAVYETTLKSALAMAWRNVAPTRLAAEHGGSRR
jgi:hypothetical protein